MDNATERLLFEHLGESALCYVLAVSGDRLVKRLEEPKTNPLDEIQEEIFRQFVELDSQLGGWQEGKSNSAEWATRLASRPDTGAQMSMGNIARVLSGGKLYEIPQDLDEVAKKALEIAVENYPGLIVKESDDPTDRRMSLPSMRYKNVLVEEFEKILITEPVFKKLFTKKDAPSGWSGFSIRSSGQGSGYQVWGFADTLINSGWSYAKLESETPSVEELAAEVLVVIDKIRKAIKGEEVSIPARIGLTGMVFPDGVDEINLGWANLRRANSKDDRFVKATTLKGQLTGTNQKGETTIIDYSGNLVVEIDIPYIISLKEMEIGATWPEELRVGFRTIEEAVENLRLGLLLAFQDERLVLHLSWQVMLDPLNQYHGASWQDVTRAINLMPTSLTKTQVKKWKKWSEQIGATRIPTIGVAIRRMLAAVAERRTPEDILVDAVIVWENLFGASTETTLRVSSSLAWLLGADATDRMEKQLNFKKIYSFRSQVVHGSPKVNEQILANYAQEAVAISINVLATIFEKRTELLNVKSSEQRSLVIMHSGATGSYPS